MRTAVFGAAVTAVIGILGLVSVDPAQAQTGECEGAAGLDYVCGPRNAEDLVQLGDSGWLIASGMSGSGPDGPVPAHLYLIDSASRRHLEWFPGPDPILAHDATRFPDCPGPLDLDAFSAHGLSLRGRGDGRFDLYMTSHGDREAIEVFEIEQAGRGRSSPPASIRWVGCVVLPDRTFANSVAALDDGGFVATKMLDPTDPDGFGAIRERRITGLVYEWHPGGRVESVPGTELSGANGITLSADGRWMYVAAVGTAEVVRFDRSNAQAGATHIPLPVRPDNLRWGGNGRLYTVGGNLATSDACDEPSCDTGWSVIEIDPETMSAVRVAGADQHAALQGASTALPVGRHLWIGTYSGDRIGVLQVPKAD